MKQIYFSISLLLFGLSVKAQNPTGTSEEVGITAGQLSVSLTGAANYTVPVLTPQGINGVEPKIALIYNSQGGNGIAGYGWNISGISAITRVASTKYHDNVIDPVDFDAYDRFALDGQRLLLKSGTYGSDGSVYETENFSNIKITLVNSPITHPVFKYYFKVDYPDGSKAIFGKDQGSQSLSEWKITSWENSKGVTILYKYIALDNNLFIASIKYGALSTGTPMNEIQFSYIPRKRIEQSFVGDQSILQKYILSTIKVLTSGIGYRNYLLSYDETYKDYQRLVKITEQSGDNSKSYNPTVFKYGDLVNNDIVNLNPPTLDLANIDFQTMGIVSGDYDGDGATDMILYPKTTADAKKKYYLYKNLMNGTLNKGIANATVGAFDEIFPSSLLRGNSTSGFKYSTEQGWTIVKYDAATNTGKFSTYSSSVITPIALEYEKTYKFPQLIYYSAHLPCGRNNPDVKYVQNIPKIYLNGDFNGDNLSDILVVEKDIQYSYFEQCDEFDNSNQVDELYTGTAYFVNMDKRLISNYVSAAGRFGLSNNSKVFVSDVNGDGKSDVLVFNSGSVRVYSLVNNSFNMLFEKYDSSIVTDKEILLGDYNGDGKADFVIPNGVDQDSWNFFMSTGTNLSKTNCAIGQVYKLSEIRKFYQEIINNNDWTTSLKENTYVSIDMNGDGKTDILNQQNYTVEEDASGNADSKPYKSPQMTRFVISFVKSYQGNSMSFAPTAPFWFSSNKINRFPIPVYANLGDNSKSATYYLVTGNSVYGLFTRFPKNDILLQQITTGNGVTESISYQPLDTKSLQGQYPVYFKAPSLENYPNVDVFSDPNFLVVSMIEQKSTNTNKKKLFQYYGAVGNVEGLGFQGFRATMQTNWFDDTTPLISNVSKYDMGRRGAVVESYSALGILYPNSALLNPYISRSLMEYNLHTDALQSNKVYKLKNISSQLLNGLDSTSKEIKTTYNSFNNPLDITTIVKEGGATLQTEYTNIKYADSLASRYIIGRPASKKVTANANQIISDELYSYNSDDLLSKLEKRGDASTNYITQNITYDSFGNVTKKTLTAGSDVRENSFEYDPTGRFLKKNTDVENLATTYVYNSNGTLKSQTDPFLQTTSYEYDAWFKKIKETDYLGFVTDITYKENVNGFIFEKKGNDGSVDHVRFDDLGRKTATGVKNIMGQMTYVTYLNDIYDRNYKISDPYIGSNSSRWNSTEYDSYGRVSKYIYSTGNTTGITITGLTTTVNDGTKTSTYIKNGLGNLISMSDSPSNTVKYAYFPNGSVKEIDCGGIKTTILQDGWGRKKEIKDPSADVISYTYNDFGDLLTEVNKNGTTTYTRNSAGKVITKTISGNKTKSKTTYTYDSSSKVLLQSKFEDLDNGVNTVVTNYKYDGSKISTVTETTPYAVFKRRFKYDGLGRIEYDNSTAKLISSNKTSSTTVKKTYKNGLPYQILDSITNNVIWQTNTVDNRGQLLTGQSGPTTVTSNYDTYGFLKQCKFDKTLPLTNILTLDYNYDTVKSNFTSRSNNAFNWSESLDYDTKDRLTTFNNSLGSQETQSYDDKGRIIQNSLGTYNYNIKDRPYQNSSVTLQAESAGYYNNREGIFSDSMEEKSGWGTEKSPNTNFFSYDGVKPSHSVGKNTLKLANTTTTEQYIFSDKWIDIDNDVATQYTYSGWVFSDNPQSEIFLYMKDAVNAVTQVSAVNNTKGVWTPISGTFLVPASVKKLRLRLDNNGLGNVWYDDVQIRRTSNAIAINKELGIDYNVFKAPEQIEETGVELINFLYNDSNLRSTMFYGGFDDKLKRPLRKHYSADGTMEIKENIKTGQVEFITYVGGDGYSAPAVVKSDGSVKKYLYLQRDYQGSILAITDETGNLLEKRLFDAWGGIVKVQDGAGKTLVGLTILDRGYTGHEHIQSVGLINMNGRLYDPKLRRFLQPDNNIQDPLNTQNFNRYGYVLNNPLKYTDPSGEFWNFVAMGLVAYIYGGAVTGEANPLKWNISNVMGALSGVGSGLGSSYVTGRANSYIESYNNKPVLGASANSQTTNQNESIVKAITTDNNFKLNSFSGITGDLPNDKSDSSEFLPLGLSVLDEGNISGRYYFNNVDNTFFDLSYFSKIGKYGGNLMDAYEVADGIYKVGTAPTIQERSDAVSELAFNSIVIGIGKKYPAVGLTIGIAKVISTTEAYKQGMQEGRQKAFILKNGYAVNHTATIKQDSGMYRECETCPLKFR